MKSEAGELKSRWIDFEGRGDRDWLKASWVRVRAIDWLVAVMVVASEDRERVIVCKRQEAGAFEKTWIAVIVAASRDRNIVTVN